MHPVVQRLAVRHVLQAAVDDGPPQLIVPHLCRRADPMVHSCMLAPVTSMLLTRAHGVMHALNCMCDCDI